ncbi:MAG: hypothetical protein A2X45_04560 [Lentisphaerae bacterium GWF2_50_93]|nr:MAG: hypothetical protein A2X45_04560 [Lentisphaerae bacterium GWF2_50_93]
MIIFTADDHYGAHPGKTIYEGIKSDFPGMVFAENDFSVLSDAELMGKCDLLILNMIAGTCNLEPPAGKAESNVKAYCERGGNMLLLHGSSAAFWHWDWWRKIVGYRWVRGNDPDGVPASTHPKRPYKVVRSKSRHPLCAKLAEMDLPEDEIYINLEQVCPSIDIMETRTDEGTFVQCYETLTPWGGRIIGFIPGHRKEVTSRKDYLDNVEKIIKYQQEGKA